MLVTLCISKHNMCQYFCIEVISMLIYESKTPNITTKNSSLSNNNLSNNNFSSNILNNFNNSLSSNSSNVLSTELSNNSTNISANTSPNNLTNTLPNDCCNISACPHCNSINFIKYGRYKNIPRFKCKDCTRTFSLRTNSIWYYSKKTPEIWKEFCMLQMECKSLSFCAKTLKINISTAFSWRHKLLNVLKLLTEPDTLQNHVFMLHHFIVESFKGSKNAPLKPRAKLWMIFSYDSYDNSLNVPYSRWGWRKDNFKKLIYSKIAPKTFISTNNTNNFIKVFAKNHNKKLKEPSGQLVSKKVEEILYSYKAIIERTRGIATKYLSQYLALSKAQCLNKVFNFKSIFNNIQNSNFQHHYIKAQKIQALNSINF